jgi:hypothetical protein
VRNLIPGKSANFWEMPQKSAMFWKSANIWEKIGKFLGNFWGKSANFWEKSANFREIGKILGNVSKSPEIYFPGATFRDMGNDFAGEEVRDTGQKPPGHNPS